MCSRATMRRPLRSKRAITSPLRPRAKASGFTRIRVLSKRKPPSGMSGSGGGRPRTGGRAAATVPARLAPWRRLLFGREATCGGARPASRPAPRGLRGRCGTRDLGLAERADLPQWIERLAARLAGLLELAQAARAAQELRLHAEAAVRAARIELREPR